MLRGEDVAAAPSANDRNFVAGLDHYYDGDYPAAVEFFDAVLAATPEHRQAAEYRRLAAGHGSGGTDVLLLLIIGCAAVAVGTAAAGMVLLRAGRRTPTPPFGFPPPVQVISPPVPVTEPEQPTVPGTTRPISDSPDGRGG